MSQPPSAPKEPPPPPLPTAAVLVVDDRLEDRVAVEAALEQVGHRTVCARSGEEAIAAAADAERENLRRLLAQAPAAVAIVRGPEHVYELSNALNQEFAGGERLVGRPAREALPGAMARGLGALLDHVYASGEAFVTRELPVRLPAPGGGGREAFLAGTCQPLRGPDGRIEGVMSLAYEVTDQVLARRRAEELAEQLGREKELVAASEARYREMLETAQEGVWLLDAAGVTTYVNRRMAEMLGYAAGEMLGQPLGEFLDDEARAEAARYLERRRRGVAERHDFRFVHRDGRDVWTIVASSPLRDGAGVAAGFLGMVTDVTERRLAEERNRALNEVGLALAASHDVREMAAAAARALVAGGFCATCGVDLTDGGDGRPFSVVECGGLPEGARGPASRATPPAMLSVPLAARGKALGALVVGGSRRKRPFAGDDVAWAKALAARVAVALDNARLFAEARRERERAEGAARAKEEFLAVVSHELRTPLNAMLGWATMLRSGELDEADRARALEVVERNARAQAKLIEDLLDVSRVVSGKLRLEPGPLDLAAVVAAAVDAVRPTAEAKGVALELAAAPAGAPCEGDAGRLQQVVLNLASNAVKFTPRGGRVRVALAHEGAHLCLRVEDTGRGIEPAFLPHVFERFRQQDGSATRAQGGLGLGLAIVKSLVELHGGTVTAESAGEGYGAAFVVRLPAAPPHPARPDRPTPALPDGLRAARARLSGVRVVVVDDDDDARELVRVLLERAAIVVRAAASAEEALRLVRDLRPDALVSDLGMPGEDGYSLLRRLRALPAAEGGATPALALTAYAGPEDRRRALLAGFSAHLPKPLEPADLLVALAAAARPAAP